MAVRGADVHLAGSVNECGEGQCAWIQGTSMVSALLQEWDHSGQSAFFSS